MENGTDRPRLALSSICMSGRSASLTLEMKMPRPIPARGGWGWMVAGAVRPSPPDVSSTPVTCDDRVADSAPEAALRAKTEYPPRDGDDTQDLDHH